LALTALAGVNAWAQATAPVQNQPQTATANAAPPDPAPPPKPQPDGSYFPGPGVTSPKIVQATPAVYPDEAPPSSSCYFRMTIGADGLPYNMKGGTSACVAGAYEAAAVEAVVKSKFEPGLLGQKPVPVRIELRVHFSPDRRPAIPQIMHIFGQPWDTPPRVMHLVEAQYSKEARRKKINGQVIVSTLVNEQGLPTDLRVEKSLGYGLDEEAVKAVSQYRFKPAEQNGNLVAARVQIEVCFQIY